MDKQEDEIELMKEATEQAKKNLEGVITPNKLGYQGFLEEEIKKLLKEKGIEWHKPNDGESVD